MACAEEEFGSTIPDCDDDFVAGVEGLRGLPEEASEPEISYFEEAGGREQDIGGFEVAVKNVGSVEGVRGSEELMEQRADHGRRDCPRVTGWYRTERWGGWILQSVMRIWFANGLRLFLYLLHLT